MVELNEITLTDGQETALKEIGDWLLDPEIEAGSKESFKTLSGYAGTGKTTLLHYIVENLRKSGIKVCVTATTNKAVKVLKEKIHVDRVRFMTIHSLLNIKAQQVKDKEIFKPDHLGKNDINRYDVVIIDECSMISKKLLSEIKKQITTNVKILFSGDPAQLQPINEEISQCFDFRPAELSEIVRYGNAIAEKAVLVRDNTKHVNPKQLLTDPDIVRAFKKDIKPLFENFRENPNKVRFLTWTNRNVLHWNKVLRAVDFGEEPDRYIVEDDVLIANEPVTDPYGNQVLANSEECKVIRVLEDDTSYVCQAATEGGDVIRVVVIKPSYKPKLAKKLKAYADAKDWKSFWVLKKQYHNVSHCYAMTVHKSQGSTFEKVVLNAQDIMFNKDALNRNQLLYVGMTRASDQVLIYI